MMKLLSITLFLWISICACLASNCFESNGYRTNFTTTGFNAILPTTGGQPLSFFEAGTINVDFLNQQLAVTYETILTNTVIIGQLYAFNGNNTMYVVNVNENGAICTKLPLSIPIPLSFPNITADLGPINIGKFQTEVLEIIENGNQEKILYDLENCAVVSAYMINIPNQAPGVTTSNFLNFKNSPAPISLPSICTTESIFEANNHQSIVTPKSIQLLLRPLF